MRSCYYLVHEEKNKKIRGCVTIEFLLLREELGLKRFRKQVKRDAEEREILMDLAMKKIEEEKRNDFILIGYRN